MRHFVVLITIYEHDAAFCCYVRSVVFLFIVLGSGLMTVLKDATQERPHHASRVTFAWLVAEYV